MKRLIDDLSSSAGGVAWAMHQMPFMPTIALASFDDGAGEGGGDDDDGDDDNDGSNDDDDDKKGDDDEGGKPSGLKGKGLFGKDDDDDKGSDDDDDDEGKKGDDGRPEHVPEKFWDADKSAVKSDDVIKAYADLEKAHGKLKRDKGMGDDVPDAATDYFKDGLDVDLEDDAVATVAPDDPALKHWADVAHEMGIGQKAAMAAAKNLLGRLYKDAPAPLDRDAELESLGKNGQNVVDGVFTFFEGMEADGSLSENDIEIVGEISKTADGIRFLQKMRNLSGAKPIPVNIGDGKSMSPDDWYSKNDKAIEKKDYKAQERLAALADEYWPDGMPNRDVRETIPLAERD